MEIKKQTCPECGTTNLVTQCGSCGRPFVLSEAHLEGNSRQFGDAPLEEAPDNFSLQHCDYCRLREESGMIEAMSAGRRQRTCPVCHTERLSGGQS